MSLVSAVFVGFMVLTILLYFVIPKKARWVVLLVASTAFYAYADWRYVIFITVSIAISYTIGRLIQKQYDALPAMIEGMDKKEAKPIKQAVEKKAKGILTVGVILVIVILAVIKYTNFAIENVSKIVTVAGGEPLRAMDIIVPLGISFYTFTIIAYMVDIFRKKAKAQTNFAKYALFVSFFPTVTQGPIQRYDHMEKQLYEGHDWDFERVKRGAQLMLWGFFMKLVIADRLSVFVDNIFNNTATYRGWMYPVALAVYSIQMYADFAGCINIAIGAAETVGIELSPNFERPYFSRTMPEFWRRWHMSLGTFFKDYIFMPVSLSKGMMNFNKFCRKKIGNGAGKFVSIAVPIFAVWALTGLWHGAAWKYIAWGLFHGVLVMINALTINLTTDFNRNHNINSEAIWYQTLQRIRTFILCCVGRLFFRSANLGQAIKVVACTFSAPSSGKITDFGLNGYEIAVAVLACLTLLFVSIYQEKVGSLRDGIKKLAWPVRWLIWIVLVMAVIVWGKYGDSEVKNFLYEAF